jgi:hypothetical protein
MQEKNRSSGQAYLVLREDKSVGDDHIFPPSSGKDYHLCNVFWCERLAVTKFERSIDGHKVKITHPSKGNLRINSICLRLVPVKSHNGEFLFVKISRLACVSAACSRAMYGADFLPSRLDPDQSQ